MVCITLVALQIHLFWFRGCVLGTPGDGEQRIGIGAKKNVGTSYEDRN